MEENKPCDVHGEQIKQLQKSEEDQWKHIGQIEVALSKFVPVWTTVVLMVMSGVTGAALTFAGMVIRMSTT